MTATASDVVQLLWPVWLAGLCWTSVKIGQLLAWKLGDERRRDVLHRLDDAVAVAVREVEQVLVRRLKAARTDGALTPDQRSAAKQAAVAGAKVQLGPRGLAELQRVLDVEPGAIDPLLGARIEAAVHQLRASGPTVGDAGTAGAPVPFSA
jgi:hypothetical protein